MKLSEVYKKREIRFLDLWSINDLTLKAYCIIYDDRPLNDRLVEAAFETAKQRVSESALATHHYGVGFVGIHQGKTGNFVFVDWWADENELHHHVYVSPSDFPEELAYKTPTGLAACAWDLYLIGYERDAWVRHVLANEKSPDLASYLSETFSGFV